MFEWIFVADAWLALVTLIVLEIILSIDNIIFLTIVVTKLPQSQQTMARRTGLLAAMLMRILLLLSLSWLAHLTYPVFSFDNDGIHFFRELSLKTSHDQHHVFVFSIRDFILLIGGLFLVWKGILEIKELLRAAEKKEHSRQSLSFLRAIIQIMFLDLIFSLDSVITAVGLGGDHLMIMILAIVISVLVMLLCAKPIGEFIERHPSMKMIALAFLILVGAMLMLDSMQIHVSKNYLYFALFFTFIVEGLNLLQRKNNTSF